MIPYVPTKQPMKGEEQEALMEILQGMVWNTPSDRLRVANRIINAGFARRVPQKVTKLQLWSYGIETVLLALAAFSTSPQEAPFIFGILWSLTFGSAVTFISGLVINHGIDKGVLT